MALKYAINGFGRIGRLVLRVASENPDFKLVGVNDITDAATLAHLLKYDSVHGRFNAEIAHDKDSMSVNGSKFAIFAEKDPGALPWGDLDVDVVIESTGRFRDRESASKHLKAGAKKVMISAPAKDPDVMIVMGVNDGDYKPAEHSIISTASCTKDLRRARAAAVSMIPTTTGAAKAITTVMPELKGRLDGWAVRVPTPDGSLVDFVVQVEKSTTVEEINGAFQKASVTAPLKGYLRYTEEPIVSIDIVGDRHSCVFDSELTTVMGGDLVKIFGWYDNEAGYASRMVDMMKLVANK
jgi:glyceraldehyde 3-phosphate dehydrogenase